MTSSLKKLALRAFALSIIVTASACKNQDATMNASGSASASQRRTSIHLEDASVDDMLTQIRKLTGADFSMIDNVRRKTNCLRFTVDIDAESNDDAALQLIDALTQKKLETRSYSNGSRKLYWDFAKNPIGPCPSDVSSASPVDSSASGDASERPGVRFLHELAKPQAARISRRGLEITSADRSSYLGELGFKSGDVVQTINGYSFTDADKALEAYARLRSAKKLSVEIMREGKPLTIHVDLDSKERSQPSADPSPSAHTPTLFMP